jgi:hypothetical protein
MSKRGFRQVISIPGLLKNTRKVFEQIPDRKPFRSILLADHLMLELAISGLKHPSLLQFDQDRFGELTEPNLKLIVIEDGLDSIFISCVTGSS